MRLCSNIFLFYLIYLLPVGVNSQTLAGKWRGYFSPNNANGWKVFTYDVQFKQTGNDHIDITSTSKFNNEFAAKAYGHGTFQNGMVQFEETRFDLIKLGSNAQGCLMTCYLTYKNVRGLAILEGTYTSKSANGLKDCGGGSVYLQIDQPIEKTIASINNHLQNRDGNKNQSVKQSILVKQTKETTLVKNTMHNVTIQKTKSNVDNASNSVTISTSPTTNAPNNNNQNISNSKDQVQSENTINASNTEDNTIENIPWVLIDRENKLVKQIKTASKSFSIDLYDNGTIDNDTINVYDNKKLLANLKRLSDKPIHLEFNFSEKTKQHEVIISAHNMGLVPPNTALLVLKENGNRQELFITTTNTFNAKIIVQYSPPIVPN